MLLAVSDFLVFNPEFVETLSATSGVSYNLLSDCPVITPHKGRSLQVAIEELG